MDERLRQSLLYDFYGELLNDHQKSVYCAAIFDDMSYSELAEEFDCSRQAAFDLIRRINKKLEDYETRLGLLARFTKAHDKMLKLSSDFLVIEKKIHDLSLEKETKKLLLHDIDEVKVSAEAIFDEF